MKNELINEVTRIKSMMIINESSLINEITLPGILKELMTVLKSEEKIILGKFLKNEIIDEVEKSTFSKFVNSSKGKLFISNLKNRVNNEIFDTLKQKRALDKIATMEQSAKDWKAVKSSVKPVVSDEIILDIKPFKLDPDFTSMVTKKGVNTNEVFNNIDKNIGTDLSKAEKIRLEFAEKTGDLHLKSKEEDLRFTKEKNDLDLLNKEVSVRINNLNKELKELDIKKQSGKITDDEKLRGIEISKKRAELRKTQLDCYKKYILIAGSLALLVYGRALLCKKWPDFCSWWSLSNNTSPGTTPDNSGGGKKNIDDY